KTSIPQLLLLLKQTAESPDRRRVLQLGEARTLVDLGAYDEAVHNHDTSQPLEIDFEWTLPGPLSVSDPLTGREFRGDRIGFHVAIAGDDRQQPFVRTLGFELAGGEGVVLDVAMERRDADGQYDLRST